MLGMPMKVSHRGIEVMLRAIKKPEIEVLVAGFNSMKVHMYTTGLFSQAFEDEISWWEKTREERNTVSWGIEYGGQLIGVTGLHEINSRLGDCTSGIIIWDQNSWGKGIASCSHLARTLFAVDYLHRIMIRSHVRTENEASAKALQRVGYSITGTKYRDAFRAGRWIDTYELLWQHPNYAKHLFPDGLPEMFREGVEKADIAIELARQVVEFV